ncbi:MAG: NHL repeat-containing protein [Rhodocyclaceae bacterium]|nr:NHL repeat-containing protein [Rhodocyclaceae bacterium]
MRRMIPAVAIALAIGGAAFAQSVLKPELRAEQANGLARPHDAALSPDGRRLYLTDMSNSRIAVLDANTLAVLGHFGEGELSYPHDAEFDAQGRLLVADTGNGRIAIYRIADADGELVGQLGGLAAPEGVAVARDGRVIATNTGSGQLSVFRDGRLIRTVGSYGNGALQFVRPHDVDAADDGHLYVVDSGNHRVQVLTPDYALAFESDPSLGLNEPKYLSFDGDRLWLADEYNHRVLLLDHRLTLKGMLGSGVSGRGDHSYHKPEAVVADRDRLWVIDTYNDRVLRYRWAAPP